MMKRIFIVLIIILSTGVARADIDLSGGFWSTSFDCDDHVFNHTSPLAVDFANYANCSDMTAGDISFFYANNSRCSGTANSTVNSTYNYSSGGGGKGLYVPMDCGDYDNGNNTTDGYLNFPIDGAPTHIWIRWYQRAQSGAGTGYDASHGKKIYLNPNSQYDGKIEFIMDLYADDWQVYVQGGTSTMQSPGGDGLDTLEGASAYDNTWHLWEIEVYAENYVRFWHGDTYVGQADLTNGPTAISNFFMNQAYTLAGSGCGFYVVDDIAIATPSYTGFVQDSGARNRIGAVGEEGDSTAPEITSVSVDEDGDTVTITLTEPTSQGSGYNDSDVDLDCSTTGNDISLTYVSGDDSASHVYTAGSTIQNGETCDFDFNGDANSLEDGAGNDLAAIVSGDVTNGSQQGIATSSGHVASYSASGQSVTFSPYGHIAIEGTTIPDNYFSDNFNRGDGALTSPWFGQGLSIATNKLEPTTDEGEVSYYNALIPDDHFSGFTITDYGTTTYAVLRGDQDPPAEGHQNCYLFRILAGQTGTRGWSLIRVASGVGATLDSGTVDIGGGDDEVFAVVQGSNPVVIWCVVNGTILSRYEDSAGNRILSGYPGVALTDAAGGGAVDNFYCGNINQLYKVVSWTLN